MPKKSSKKRGCSDEEDVLCKQSRFTSTETLPPLCFHSPESFFNSLIKPMETELFFREYWEKKPLHLQRSDPHVAAYYKTLFQLSDLQHLCSKGLKYYTDVNVVRCINGKKQVYNREGQLQSRVLTANLTQNKASIQLHQPQRFKDELWKILEKLESFFGALVGSNIYITPEDSQGLPAHHDDVEVFVLQLEGQKRWRLYSPTVPLATEYGIQSEETIGSPAYEIILQAGDLLYFPRGTIHQAVTPAGVTHSTHLTLSTYQRMSWGDLMLDMFPSMLLDRSKTEVSLRAGIPRRHLLGCSEEPHTNRRLAAILRLLADDLETGMPEIHSTHMKKDFIMNRLPPYSNQQLMTAGRFPALRDTVSLRFKDHIMFTVEASQQRTEEATELFVFIFHSLKNRRESHMMGENCDEEEQSEISKGLRFPLSHLHALQQLHKAEQLAVTQLQLPTEEEKVNLVLALWSESLLHII